MKINVGSLDAKLELGMFLAKFCIDGNEATVLRRSDELGFLRESGEPADAVRNEAISLSSSNPNRQLMAYTRRGSVLGNSVSDGRNRDHAVSISFLSTRTSLR